MPPIIRTIQAATLAARARLADNTIGTRTQAGRMQVVRVTYDAAGRSTTVPASDWMLPHQVPAFIAAL